MAGELRAQGEKFYEAFNVGDFDRATELYAVRRLFPIQRRSRRVSPRVQ